MDAEAVYYPENWYAIAETSEVLEGRPLGIRRFGVDLVLWRDSQGKLSVLRDLCPHRSVKLSAGKVAGDFLQCAFHGFRYDTAGICRHVPEINRAAPGLKVKTYECREENGFVWLWWGENAAPSDRTPVWFAQVRPGMKASSLAQTWDCTITRAIENQLDYAHLPFLHGNTIGRGFDPSREVRFELAPDGLRFFPDAARGEAGAWVGFRMPNLWLNKITDRFLLILVFAPVDAGRTKFYLRTYQSFVTFPVLSGLVTWLLSQTNRLILRQDRAVVETHPAGCTSLCAQEEKLFPSDKGIRHFRALWGNPAGEREKVYELKR